MRKTPDEAWDIIDSMETSKASWPSERQQAARRPQQTYAVGSSEQKDTEVEGLKKQLAELKAKMDGVPAPVLKVHEKCELCAMGHTTPMYAICCQKLKLKLRRSITWDTQRGVSWIHIPTHTTRDGGITQTCITDR